LKTYNKYLLYLNLVQYY